VISPVVSIAAPNLASIASRCNPKIGFPLGDFLCTYFGEFTFHALGWIEANEHGRGV
jgi:hypothetical protein